MGVEVRTITPDEALAWRRAVRGGFHLPDTVDDADWVARTVEPVDRVFAAFDAGRIVATYQSFPTELTVPGGAAVEAGAVTAVTCRATHRRQGLLTRMITEDLTASAERGEPVEILIAAEYPIYGRFGYGPAVVSTSWELDAGRARFVTPGGGTIEEVDNDTFRREAPGVFERVRAERPGMIGRDDIMWDMAADIRRQPESQPWRGFRVVCRDAEGAVEGWASYTVDNRWDHGVPRATAAVADMLTVGPGAATRLWRYLAELDHVGTVTAGDRPTDEVLPWLLADARAARETARRDFVWVRPLDVVATLRARTSPASGQFVVEVVDPMGFAGGRYRVDAAPSGIECRRTDESADLTMPVATLGAVCLGGASVRTLHAARWLDEHTPGSVAVADAVLASPVPPWWRNTWF